MDRASIADTLIPQRMEWNNGEGVDASTWVSGSGTYELAIGYTLVFWPDFVRYGPYIFRADAFTDETVKGFEDATGNSRQAIEAVINHVHLQDIHVFKETSEVQLRYLGNVMKEMLEAKLARDFPELSFEVLFNDEPGLDLLDYEVTFWQIG